MLAPGDYLLVPDSQTPPALGESKPPLPANRGEPGSPENHPGLANPARNLNMVPTAVEPRSFLTILLTALGAIHS